MTQLNSFEIDGIRFVMDIRAGSERGKSSGNEFILVKTQAFMQFYRGLQRRNPKTILELGMFEGGSLVLFDKLFSPNRLVGVDIRDEIPALEIYRTDRSHIRTLYRQSQDDASLPTQLREHFPDGIDLIVDDASHLYPQTKASFELCFPLLKPGGLYVIEDWSWSHMPASQDYTHPWYNREALTNLIFELVVSLPRSTQMNRITVLREMVLIEKAAHADGTPDLQEAQSRLRGRALPLI